MTRAEFLYKWIAAISEKRQKEFNADVESLVDEAKGMGREEILEEGQGHDPL